MAASPSAAAPVAALLLLACAAGGGSSRAPLAPKRAAPPSTTDAGAPAPHVANADGGGAWATFDDLADAARGAAAGMREQTRDERTIDAANPVTVVRAEKGDVCARLALASARPARVRLEDTRGHTLGAADIGPVPSAPLLPALGPACVRRGDGLVLVVEGDGAAEIRSVIWVSP